MKVSARNVMKGKVTNIDHGVVNSEITLELPGGAELVSIITKKSAESLGLKVGEEAYAIVKATNVLIAID